MTTTTMDYAGGDKSPLEKRPAMLALFDVLGFSARLESESVEQILLTYQDLINKAVLVDAYRCLGVRDAGIGTGAPVLFALPVEYAYFSDTILMWAPLEQLFAPPFVGRCANLICEALAIGVPLRGALAIGEAVLHKPTGTYIGMPLVEAARLESRQRWLGMGIRQFSYLAAVLGGTRT